jgi:hypothetical protein
MKKTLFSLGVFLFSTALVAQNKVDNTVRPMKKIKQSHVAKSFSLGPESEWISWGGMLADNADDFSIDPSFWQMSMMPDSLTLIGPFTDGTYGSQWIHSAATIVDPTEDLYDWLDENNSYTIDSLSIAYIYERNLDASVVDTMRIQVINHISNTSGFDLDNDGNTDEETIFAFLEYDYDPNVFKGVLGSQVSQEILVPLTSSDTAVDAWRYLDIAVPGTENRAAGERFGIAVDFIPGYSYSLGDTLNNLNRFGIITFEENEDEEPDYAYSLNRSYFLRSSVRYNINENNWNGVYQPAHGYGANFRFEHHMFYYKLSSPNVGTVELDGTTFEVSPNPSTGFVSIEATEALEGVQLNIFNLVGQSVMTTEINGLNTTLNLSGLDKGIYLMNFNMEGQTITKKIVLK